MKNLMSMLGLVSMLVSAAPAAVHAQERAAPPDAPISAAMRKSVLDSLVTLIERDYVFPEVAKDVVKALRRHVARGGYDHITSARAFADTLNDHLYAVAHDLHLRVFYDPARQMQFACGAAPVDRERARTQSRQRNCGFERLQRLPGNVGYLDLRAFDDPDLGAADQAAAAMSWLANSDAMIIDLRRNGGGFGAMVDLLYTYLVAPSQRVHLFDFRFRNSGKTGVIESWTLPQVPGPRFAGKDVYVLISPFTGSAAESFAYAVQAEKRGTLIGEKTAGAGNPGSGTPALPGGFGAFVASGRVTSPATGSNWEGVGVEPDVAVSADVALREAHVMAVKKLLENVGGDGDRERLQRALATAERTPPDPVEAPPGLRIPRF